MNVTPEASPQRDTPIAERTLYTKVQAGISKQSEPRAFKIADIFRETGGKMTRITLRGSSFGDWNHWVIPAIGGAQFAAILQTLGSIKKCLKRSSLACLAL